MSRKPRPSRLLGIVIVAALLISGCGYHFAASGDMLPASAQTIYVARFGNQTRVTGINDELMRYIKDEIDLHRRLKVVDSPDAADLELSGEVRFATADADQLQLGARTDPIQPEHSAVGGA